MPGPACMMALLVTKFRYKRWGQMTAVHRPTFFLIFILIAQGAQLLQGMIQMCCKLYEGYILSISCEIALRWISKDLTDD